MKVWSVKQVNKQKALAVAQSMDIHPFLALMLDIRGLDNENAIRDFLSEENGFSDPFLMKDMDKAVSRINKAVENGEKICVYGDYDADGVTATALLYSYLNDSVGADVMFYIPARETEGYGMNKGAVDKLHEKNIDLIITVDNGISAFDEIEYANSLGIDTVVTDHHVPSRELPPAVAIVDVNQPGDNTPYKFLSGVGVAFKLIMALEGEYCDVDFLLENFSDIVAIGTVGDVVPLTGENRALVKAGLRHIQNSDRIGINAMKTEAGIADKKINSGTISFTIVPRINAGGRLGLSEKSVRLLITEDEDEAQQIASELGSDNSDRQNIEKQILDAIDQKVKAHPDIVTDKIIVIDGENWHHGVIGIVASRIKDIYDKPTIIIGVDENGEARGSGRSVEGFALCDAVFACTEYLTHYGGHPMAVGLSLKKENIKNFRRAINNYCRDITMPYSKLEIDCKLNPATVAVSIPEIIQELEPFGAENPSPLFGLFDLTITEIKFLSGNKHTRFTLKRDDTYITAIKFGMTSNEVFYRVGDVVDLAVTLDINTFRGQESLSIFIKDIKYSDCTNEAQINDLRIFEKFASRCPLTYEEAQSILPSREDFALVYRFLRKSGTFTQGEYFLLKSLDYKIKMGKLRIILHSMKELGLIYWTQGLYGSKIELRESGRVNLDKSIFIRKLREVR